MEKQYEVEVRRTEVRTIKIRVTANDEAEAHAKAIDLAADADMYVDGRSVDVDYEVCNDSSSGADSQKPLTHEQQYLAGGGNCCPACGSSELDAGTLQSDGLRAWRNVECEDCGASWDEHFKMTGISDADGFEPDAPATPAEAGA